MSFVVCRLVLPRPLGPLGGSPDYRGYGRWHEGPPGIQTCGKNEEDSPPNAHHEQEHLDHSRRGEGPRRAHRDGRSVASHCDGDGQHRAILFRWGRPCNRNAHTNQQANKGENGGRARVPSMPGLRRATQAAQLQRREMRSQLSKPSRECLSTSPGSDGLGRVPDVTVVVRWFTGIARQPL